jgi:hypothetical protein
MGIPQQAVIDAWADMKSWVEGTLPGQAQGSVLPQMTSSIGDIGACNALNSPGGGGAAIWENSGSGTLTLTSLSISSLKGVVIQTASFTDAQTVHLPFTFSQIQVKGSYTFTEPCGLYEFGKKISSSSAGGDGSMTQTVGNSSMYYVATVTDKLTLSGVTIAGQPSVDVKPDTGGLPDWLSKIADFFSTFNEKSAVTASLENVFRSAGFSNTLINLMNTKLGAST